METSVKGFRTVDGSDPTEALLTQLHYDRADIAPISSVAAKAMDVVIAMVVDAIRDTDRPIDDLDADPGGP